MTADSGSSRSQAEVHAEVRDDLVEDDVRQICATLSTSVVRAYCALNHPPRTSGWPRLGVPDTDDLDVEAVVALAGAGLRIPADWARERAGIPMPKDDEEVLTGSPAGQPAPGAAGDPPPDGAREALALLAEAAAWGEISDELVAPVRAALGAATGADDFLSRLDADVPEALAADLAQKAFERRVTADQE